ncbi:unnamed protein product [Lepeophtheirus salmonis]|uniref:(salmon louse) hypothetical protein n=1 Tax=Lepeophtheirus salmonis TaxID=72036 RepID=A0A7R8D315_LEPSM|nr:unnamed protein product [Lepeophtheirus salmonis]CAF3012506.1 unnamed protein product [Lepeophtheirus salmonis]
MGDSVRHNPTINIQQPTLFPSKSSPKITRTPSHESILESRIPSGLKVSFRGEHYLSQHRGSIVPNIRIPSPLPNEHLLLSIPPHSMSKQNNAYGFDDEYDMIKSCAVLAKALGLQKSFSTSDILSLKLNSNLNSSSGDFFNNITKSFSEMHLMDAIPLAKLEASSRSLSTWVAVGDKSATSQLPTRNDSATPAFTPADLIRSVNKKIRQNYMRKRLLTTYRALERMSQSGFNLEKIEVPHKFVVKTSHKFSENCSIDRRKHRKKD